MKKELVEKFCNIIKSRSQESEKSIKVLLENNLIGNSISILRQELDSLIRVVYLLGKTQFERQNLIQQTLLHERWTDKRCRYITDERMVVSSSENLSGYVKYVYDFACGFIHLSPFHFYREENPFDFISPEDKQNIKQYMIQYHCFPSSSELNFETMTPFVWSIFDKLTRNLGCYLEKLENEEYSDDIRYNKN